MRNRLGKKTELLGGAAALVVSTMVLPAGATNLLVNPGFESPTSNTNPNTAVTDWTLYGSECRANYQNHTAGGEWSIWEQTFEPFGGVQQVVGSITAGTDYTLSCWEYFEANYPTTGAVGDLELTWYGPGTIGGGAPPIGTPAETLIQPNTVTTLTWTQYSITNAVAPAGATQVLVSFDFTNGSNQPGQIGGFVDDADLEGAGIPPTTAEWAVNSSGDWNASGNWTTGSIPNGAGLEADFFSAITSNTTVYTNVPIVAGTLHFNNANEYEITGTGNLTLQATGSNSAMVEVDQGMDELDLPLTIASNTVFNVAPTATLVVGNPVTINSGKTLSQEGTGTVTYQSIITVLSGGALVLSGSTHAHELSLASTATASITSPNGGVVLTVDNLSNSGTLNVANNELIVNYGAGADPITSIIAQIKSGYNGGHWNGTGIISTSAQIEHNGLAYGLGYADAADAGNPAHLSSGQIEVKYTLLGDANLDGIVNAADFTILAANFNQPVTAWDQGDFNYDGLVNAADFTDLAANFNQSASGAASAGDVAALDAFAAANGLSLPTSSVPEPASLGLLALGAVGVLARRRRQ
ncbi:MAG: PEP-CTERM sorting domain-containing protein [Tepidisphaeraceae bacterium]|jgi:PEP-CTERM motif-containing protein/dockerin type I repeat protein